MACPATDRWTSVSATADAPDDDDEDDLDDTPDLIASDSEGEVSYGVPREVQAPLLPALARS